MSCSATSTIESNTLRNSRSCSGRLALLNVIPYNRVAGLPYEEPTNTAKQRFMQTLTDAGSTSKSANAKGRNQCGVRAIAAGAAAGWPDWWRFNFSLREYFVIKDYGLLDSAVTEALSGNFVFRDGSDTAQCIISRIWLGTPPS